MIQMMGKSAITALLIIIVVTVLVLPFELNRAGAAGAFIYIRENGSIEPDTAPILTAGNVTYVLTNNINASVVIERDSIILDGANHTVQDTQGFRGIDLTLRKNVTVKNFEIKSFDYGFYLENSTGNSLFGNRLTANKQYGIYGIFSLNNSIADSAFTANAWAGIHFYHCDYNAISENAIADSTYGVYLYRSLFNKISANHITSCTASSIWLDNQSNNCTITENLISENWNGIYFSIYTHYCTISENTIMDNEKGIMLSQSPNNRIFANNLTGNSYGLSSYDTENNTIYHNNFVNNTHQTYNEASTNIWDDGYPSGGNYWSDYTGSDSDGDGIGDTPYAIDGNNTDRYPLTNEYVIPEFPRLFAFPVFVVMTMFLALTRRKRFKSFSF